MRLLGMARASQGAPVLAGPRVPDGLPAMRPLALEREAVNDYSHLQTIQPALAEEALRASGRRVGNRIPGTQVLHREFRKNRDPLSLGECFDLMTDLQKLEMETTTPTDPMPLYERAAWIRWKIDAGTRIYNSTGGQGPCRCLLCRLWCMWMEDLEEALSEE